jgi:tetratricopeptide (TPR) repeat protein
MPEIKFSKTHKIKEDRFVEFTTIELPQKVQLYKKQALLAVAVIAAVAIAVWAVRTSRDKTSQSANELFGKALVALDQGELSPAISSFQQLAEKYSGTDFGKYSLYYMGDIYYRMNNFQGAIDQYRRFIKAYSAKNFLSAAARKGLAASYQQTGDLNKAVETYSEIIHDFPQDFSVPEALFKRARLYAKVGKPDLARADCERVLREYKSSAYRDEVANFLAAL